MSESVVELEGVTKAWEERQVLGGVDLTVQEGERFAIIGPSGSGKSTLLNILGTLDRPTEGTVRMEGMLVSGLKDKELAVLRSEKIGFIFQLHHLLPQCTVLENVLVPTLALPKKPDQDVSRNRAMELLGRVGLESHVSKHPAQLSGGERQRVAVVRALINGPRLLLADEPTGALDEKNASALVDLLLEISEAENTALIMVTHDRGLADRLESVKEIKDGRLV